MIRLLHGAVGDPSDWDSFIPLLEPHRAVAPDLYGGKIMPFADVGKAINSYGRGGDVLIGYSMGGRLALHALIESAAPWSKAVIIGADPGSGSDVDRVARDTAWAALARADWDEFCRRWAEQPVFGGKAMPWGREADVARREEIARGFEEWSVGLQEDLRPRLAALSIPVLWIAGEDDEKFAALARELSAMMPAGRCEIVAGAGHRVPWDQAESLAQAIQSFLS